MTNEFTKAINNQGNKQKGLGAQNTNSQDYPPVLIITNKDPLKIKVDSKYDYKYKVWRIEMRLKK